MKHKIADDILTEINDLCTYGVINKEEFINFTIMFKLVGYTRDIN